MMLLSLRYFFATSGAIVITLGLFYLMLLLTTQQITLPKDITSLEGIEFVRLDLKQPKTFTPTEKLPKPPPKLKPPPPPTHPSAPTRPMMAVPALAAPTFDLSLNFMGAPSVGQVAPVAVTSMIIPLVRIPPRYPLRAKRLKLSGSVIVEFTIDTEGRVKNPKVRQANPPKIFDNAALAAIRRWKFKPKLENGKAVPQLAIQEITFKLPQQR